MIQTVVGQQPSLLATTGHFLVEPAYWMTAAVPIALALFGLRFTRNQLPRRRALYGLIGALLWAGFQATQLFRAFDGIHTGMRTTSFTFFLAVFPVLVAGVAGLAIGLWRRLALRIALPLAVLSAMIATATGLNAAFSIVELVNAAG
jgi:hypothetical protein